MKKAIVLLSGGQDSTTCLFWALQNFEHVEAIAFSYGQRHGEELKAAARIAAMMDVPFEILNAAGLLGGSSLTDHSKPHNVTHDIDKNLPASFTAGRNALFLTVAAGIAFNRGIKNIVTGVCQTDYSGYPDCRQEFIFSMEMSLCYALGLKIGEMKIHTPLMNLTKAETWKLAADLKGNYTIDGKPQLIDPVQVVKLMTITDYNGDTTMNDWGMGREDNPASVLRAKGYREAVEKGFITID